MQWVVKHSHDTKGISEMAWSPHDVYEYEDIRPLDQLGLQVMNENIITRREDRLRSTTFMYWFGRLIAAISNTQFFSLGESTWPCVAFVADLRRVRQSSNACFFVIARQNVGAMLGDPPVPGINQQRLESDKMSAGTARMLQRFRTSCRDFSPSFDCTVAIPLPIRNRNYNSVS